MTKNASNQSGGTYKRGLTPFDPVKHARFKTAEAYGTGILVPTYPINKNPSGLTAWGMDGNGPDPTLTVNGGNPVGDCGPCAVPAHANMLTAILLADDLAGNTMTSDQVVDLYFEFTGGQDTGVDLGDWLLWLFKKGIIGGFLAIPLDEVDAALDEFDVVVGGWILTDSADQDFANGVPFDVGPGNEPDPDDGHCMLFLGVESDGGITDLCTWGGVATCTPAFRKACLQQAFAVLTDEQSTKVPGLVEDLKALGGTTIAPGVVPAPAAPPPPPAPAPQRTSWWLRFLDWIEEHVS